MSQVGLMEKLSTNGAVGGFQEELAPELIASEQLSSRFDESLEAVELVSRSQTRSRPRRVLRTRPASARTRRCFVMAWRDTADFALRCVIDPAPNDRAVNNR
jgi:hypothetical protein